MKRFIVLVFALALTAPIFAQSSIKLFKMPLKRAGISLGIEWDKVQNFSAASFERMAGVPNMSESLGLDTDNASIYSGYCENPHLRLQAAWQMGNDLELVTSALAIINRFDGLTFYDDDWTRYDNYVTLNSWGSEIAADVAVIKRMESGPFSIQLGIGGNTGYSFDNTIDITGSIRSESAISNFKSTGINRLQTSDYGDMSIETYDVSNGISQRLYGQAGVSFTLFKRVEIGMEGRWGYGYRWHFDGSPIGTNLRSIGGVARWVLN